MSEMSLLAFDELPRGVGGVGATEEIARALHDSGIDAPSSLYDESLAFARQGRLAASAERLRMLLCLDPTDAEAALLLGKVLAGRGQWQESLAQLDLASTNGAILPPGLREQVEGKLRQHIDDAEAHRERVAARERGEIKNLRSEAKRLRSDNASLEQQVDELSRRVKIWSSATALIAGAACALMLVSILFGGNGDEAIAAGDEATVPVATAATGSTVDLAAPTATTTTVPVAPASTRVPPAETVRPPTTATTATTAATVAAPVVAPAVPAAKPVTTGSKTHVVTKGDTLGKLANKYYGKSSEWPKIQKANRDQLGSSEALQVGMKLTIP